MEERAKSRPQGNPLEMPDFSNQLADYFVGSKQPPTQGKQTGKKK
jgi:hypothetical protein